MAILLAVSAAAAREGTEIRRYLLSIGANDGGHDRVLLRYAVTDAKAFASVLTDMGGVNRQNAVILANPGKEDFLSAFANMEGLIAKDKGDGARSEAFIYYSGHADVDGLKLGKETLGWYDFRNAVNNLGADVRVAVVDACGSGVVTRTKGGTPAPAFLLDASKDMKGYAFLASSNANEASQESDRIKGGYFTHALLNGMRGAADLTGDGTVTINEAYQYAFNETLRSTQNTSAGTQHPSRDMNLAGTGDILMTDLRRTAAILALAPDAEGRLFIRDASGNLFAELQKQGGRSMELGMPRGKYSVQMETRSGALWTADGVVVAGGGKTELSMSDMRKTGRTRATARGNAETGFGDMALTGLRNIAYNGIFDATLYADASGNAGASLRAGTPWIYGLVEYNTVADIKYIENPVPPSAPPTETNKPPSSGITNVDSILQNKPQGVNGKPIKPGDTTKVVPNERLYTASGYVGLGVGTRFGMNGPFFINLDLINRVAGHSDMMHDFFRLRLGAAYIPSPYLAISAGASLNAVINRNGGAIEYRPTIKYQTGNAGAVFWPDVYIGLTTGKILSGWKSKNREY
jgi:hypothetical protein